MKKFVVVLCMVVVQAFGMDQASAPFHVSLDDITWGSDSLKDRIQGCTVACDPKVMQGVVDSRYISDEILELLLSAGAGVNQPRSARSLLSIALGQNFHQRVKILLDHGADSFGFNHHGITPLLEAKMITDRQECIEHIIAARKKKYGESLLSEIPVGSELFNHRVAELEEVMSDDCIAELHEALVLGATEGDTSKLNPVIQALEKTGNLAQAFFATLIYALKISSDYQCFERVYLSLQKQSPNTFDNLDLEEIMSLAVMMNKWRIIYMVLLTHDISPRKALSFIRNQKEWQSEDVERNYRDFRDYCEELKKQRR